MQYLNVLLNDTFMIFVKVYQSLFYFGLHFGIFSIYKYGHFHIQTDDSLANTYLTRTIFHFNLINAKITVSVII